LAEEISERATDDLLLRLVELRAVEIEELQPVKAPERAG
jgi:hypothetical protein